MKENLVEIKEENKEIDVKNKDIFIKPTFLQILSIILVGILGVGAGLFFKPDTCIYAIQGSLFAMTLTYMAMVDYKLHLVSDYFIFGIVALSLITIVNAAILGNYYYMLFRVIAGIIIPLPLFIASFSKSGGIGGGDIKLMSACALVLGIDRGLGALMVGLLLAVVIQLIIMSVKKLDKKTTRFALVPYLAFSCIVFYYI